MKDINDSQVRHEMLIDFLSQFTQYQVDGKPRLKKVKKIISSDKVHKIDFNDINISAVLLADFLNIGSGSFRNIDLYRLLQAYLLIPDCRDEINAIVNNAHRTEYTKTKKK